MLTYISSMTKKEYRLVKTFVTLRGGKRAEVFYFIADDVPLKKGTYFANDLPKQFKIVELSNGKPIVQKNIEKWQ